MSIDYYSKCFNINNLKQPISDYINLADIRLCCYGVDSYLVNLTYTLYLF